MDSRVPLVICPGEHNSEYLNVKRQKLGHMLEEEKLDSIDIDPFEISQNGGFYHFSYPFNMSGNPAASIPCGFSSEGLPVGVQIIGRKGDELSVLKASSAFEKISPWKSKYPPISMEYIN